MATFTVRLSGGTGLRVAVKDIIDMTGLPTTAGCRAVERRASPATVDADCLAGLRSAERAGRVRFVGRTNLNELALGIDGVNPWFGTPVNPLDPSRVPGGSSSGSAVAVASGEADLALGTDTGGSNRIPAACCGVCGLKTTWGRIPTGGTRPLAPSFDTIGPLARDVAGLVLGMQLLEPGFAAVTEPPSVVGRFRPAADPEVDGAIDEALHRAGLTVTEVRLPRWREAEAANGTLLVAEAWQVDGPLLGEDPAGVGEAAAVRLRRGGALTPGQLAAASAVRTAWRAELDTALAATPVIALPTLTADPPLLAEAQRMFEVRATQAVNLAGVPAVSIPVPRPGRLPAGLQLVGATGTEETLLAVAGRVEAALRG